MSEFEHVTPAVTTVLGVSHGPRLRTEAEVGLSVNELASLLNFVSGSNAHTHPPPKNKKVEPIVTFSSAHMNVFLRVYLAGQARLTEGALRALAQFCRCNDAAWVYRCQQLSLQTMTNDLDARAFKKDAWVASALPTTPDDPVMLPQLRANLPWLRNNLEVPHVSFTTPHFRHIVGAAGQSAAPVESGSPEKDRFYSSHVKIKNDGKKPVEVRIYERLTFVDGVLVEHAHYPSHAAATAATAPTATTLDTSPTTVSPPPTPSFGSGSRSSRPDDVDFQVLLDKNSIKRGETATVLLSLIARTTAVFNDVLEVVILSVDDGVKIVVTFAIVNPFLPLFGSPFPNCIAQTVLGSPIGQYQAPAVLQMLKHKFILNKGLAFAELHSALFCGHSASSPNVNRAALSAALAIRERLDDEADTFAAIASTAELGGRKTATAAETSSAGGGEEAVLTPPVFDDRHGVAPSPSLPPGFAPGALAPTAKASAAAGPFPRCLDAADPLTLFSLMLLWLAEFPMAIFDESIAKAEPFAYVASLDPCLQGVVWWIVDLCCALLVHSDANGVSLRALANCFAAVLVGDNVVGDTSDAVATAMTRAVHMRLHVTTTLVKIISRYRDRYEKKASKA